MTYDIFSQPHSDMKTPENRPVSILDQLISEVHSAVIARSPVTKAEEEYQERSRQWMVERERVRHQSDQMIARGELSAARILCDNFNATKPRRSVGRPRLVKPKSLMLHQVTLEVVVNKIIPSLSKQQRSKIVEAAATEIIDRLA